MIEVQGLSIKLGEFQLHGVDLRVESGEYAVVLGPTGAGKTVLLECIAGLHQPSAGKVLIDEVDLTGTPPEKRGVAYVPQDYCLFPHLTVTDNIAFGLRLRHWSSADITQRVAELAELLKIDHLLRRRPLTLSGGEKQRVALARALAIEPRLLLLDEPLAAVDERTRDRLCLELKAVQQRLGATIIHVCHNFGEALALADRIAIFSAGEIRQVGVPEEVFHRPNSRFVATFTGCGNLLEGEVSQNDGRTVFVAGELSVPATVEWHGPAALVIRSEELVVRPNGVGTVPATVVRLTRGERFHRVWLQAAGNELEAVCGPDQARELGLAPGQPVSLELPPGRCHLLPAESGVTST